MLLNTETELGTSYILCEHMIMIIKKKKKKKVWGTRRTKFSLYKITIQGEMLRSGKNYNKVLDLFILRPHELCNYFLNFPKSNPLKYFSETSKSTSSFENVL